MTRVANSLSGIKAVSEINPSPSPTREKSVEERINLNPLKKDPKKGLGIFLSVTGYTMAAGGAVLLALVPVLDSGADEKHSFYKSLDYSNSAQEFDAARVEYEGAFYTMKAVGISGLALTGSGLLLGIISTAATVKRAKSAKENKTVSLQLGLGYTGIRLQF